MRLDMMDRMRRTKTAFRRKVLLLGKVVAKNDKKANIAITKLTGVVRRNDARSRSGRKLIASLEEANKAELKSSLRTAIQKGEKRAAAVLKSGKRMIGKTKAALTLCLKAEVSKLAKETHSSLESIALQSKAARAELKKEMTYAIRSAASVAKKDLRLAIAASKRKMLAFMRRSAASKARSALARKALLVKLARNKRAVARMISGAVATQTRAQLALRAETAKKIKKTNMRVTAYAARMARDAKRTAAKFNAVYRKLAANRARADSRLAAATNGLNDALAKQAALADSRFSKTVKDLRAARSQASRQVAQLRKSFTSNLSSVTSHIKDVETRLTSEISVVSAEVVSVKANQMRVNRRVAGEIRRIRKIANKRHSQARRARGKLKMLMDENKAAAAQEVKALARDTVRRIGHLRARAARNRIAMARDLTRATKKLYKHMSKMQNRNLAASRRLNRSISASKVATRNALKHAKRMFASKVVMLSNTVAANLKRNKADI